MLSVNKYSRTFVGFFLLLIIGLGNVAAAESTGNSMRQLENPIHYYQMEKSVVILYDPTDRIANHTARSIYRNFKMLYENTILNPVVNKFWLERCLQLYSSDTAIFIHVYPSSINGVELKYEQLTWAEFFHILLSKTDAHHVLGMGNGANAATALKAFPIPDRYRIHTEEEGDEIDIQVIFIYVMWECAEIFSRMREEDVRYSALAQDLRYMTIQFLSQNINEVMTRNYEPKEPMGEVNEEMRGEVYEEFEKRHPTKIEPMATSSGYHSPLIIQKESDPKKLQPGMLMMPQRANGGLVSTQGLETGISIASIPGASGLPGPIAGAFDPILNLILDYIGNILGLPMDLITAIVNIILRVQELSGFLDGEISEDSDLSEFIDDLRTQFPYSKEFLPYFDLISLTLAKLRGGVSDGWDWLLEGYAELTGQAKSDWLIDQLNMTFQELTLAMISGDNPGEGAEGYVEALLADMIPLYLQNILDKLMNDTLDLSPEDSAAIRAMWNATFDWMIRLFAERDLSYSEYEKWALLIQEFYDGLPNFGKAADDDSILNATAALLRIMLGVTEQGFSDQPLLPMLEEVLYTVLPEGITSAKASIQATIAALKPLIDNAIQSKQKSVENFETLVKMALANALRDLTRSDWQNFLTDLVLFLTARYNANFIITGEFPTVQSLLLQYLELVEASPSLSKILGGIISSVMGLLAITTNKNPLKRMVGGTIAGYQAIVTANLSTFVIDVCGLALNSTHLTNTTFMEKIKDFAEIMLGVFQVIVNGWENPIQTVFQTLMLTTASCLIKDLKGEDFDISYLHDLNLWLLDQSFLKYEEETFRPPTDIDILTDALIAFQASGNLTYYFDVVRPILMRLTLTRNILTTGIRWFYSQLMTWQERKSQELIIDFIRELYLILSEGDSFIAAAKTKRTLEKMGYHERLENDPRLADLKGIEMEKDKIIVTDPNSPYMDDIKRHRALLLQDDDTGDELEGEEDGSSVTWVPFSWQGEYTFEVPKKKPVFEVALAFELAIDVDVEFDYEAFSVFVGKELLAGGQLFEKSDLEKMRLILDFLYFSPILYVKGSAEAGTSSKPFVKKLIKAIGVEIKIGAEIWARLSLFTFNAGTLEFSEAFRPLEFGFKVWVQLSASITLLDILTGGTSKGLSEAAKYIGLDLLTLTLYLRLEFQIVLKAASKDGPQESVLTLSLIFGARLSIGIDLGIFGFALAGTLEVGFTFIQDLASLKLYELWFFIRFTFEFTVTFFFFDIEFSFTWEPVRELLTPTSATKQPDDPGPYGPDSDGDGLADVFEELISGLDKNKRDTDGDGLNDKFEYFTSKTDPSLSDTDGDGLSDFTEIVVKGTNPHFEDTDFDGLTDYQEAAIYGTNPKEIDTDGDGLDDAFEVYTAWDITSVTSSVTEVIIGGVAYNNHTDPLHPDTDGDGLLDGEEGPRGVWYGAEYLTNFNGSLTGDDSLDGPRDTARDPADPILFNLGFTHPLDNDTDDDSYEQLWDGRISPRRLWLRGMTDGDEVFGRWITFINQYGEPTLNLTRTNPCNPDTDGDTGREAIDYGDWWNATLNPNVPYNKFLNSDGYELQLEPPSDPNDGDSDDDGLIDGLEGTLDYESNHTHYLNPDTDGDGLGDLQEMQLGSNPRSPDTDNDMISDGDEYFVYGTEPFLPDSDFDGLSDGLEVFIFHSNPRQLDSDGDGLSDAAEVLDYGTDPVDEDSDNDGLTDYEEVRIYGTDPRIDDTDADGLLDGEEINTYKTDPFLWDTDNDSISYLNESNMITFPLGDGYEIKISKTNPTTDDTDKDGILDGWELYLASGWVPTHVLAEPILLNPISNDTDGDGLLDGDEMVIMNRTSLIYPYIAFYVEYPLNSHPDNADTDGDDLNDYDEITVYHTDPENIDSDNDTLKDGHEVFYHKTNPASNDTDGDGLRDDLELTQVFFMTNAPSKVLIDYSPIYITDASNSDTDGDRLPDGAELFFYETDPRNADVNENGFPDGLDYDTDHDMLEDGLEFYGYVIEVEEGNETRKIVDRWTLKSTAGAPDGDGGILNPDSDHDGIADGLEYYGYGTNASNSDSDNDTYSDGLEIAFGTDPLKFDDDPSTIYAALDSLNETVILLLPRKPVKVNNVPIVAKTLGNMTALQVSYRIRSLHSVAKTATSDWSAPELLRYNKKYDQWESSRLLENNWYEIEVTAVHKDGNIDISYFIVRIGELPPNNLLEKIPEPVKSFLLGFLMIFSTYLGLLILRPSIRGLKSARKERKSDSSPRNLNEEDYSLEKEDA